MLAVSIHKWRKIFFDNVPFRTISLQDFFVSRFHWSRFIVSRYYDFKNMRYISRSLRFDIWWFGTFRSGKILFRKWGLRQYFDKLFFFENNCLCSFIISKNVHLGFHSFEENSFRWYCDVGNIFPAICVSLISKLTSATTVILCDVANVIKTKRMIFVAKV